ncbi:MATE family efflux transporter [Aliigemmobacter aestuarii]|uniref:Multidrug-efflux transporter n=2 Tax=Aliigemmobacter aestuarii TaxID=1445661 RepID=A0A4S3MLH6_9RHOB|nr:MATE family efflux transporter [Gemmobacter aestuarii]
MSLTSSVGLMAIFIVDLINIVYISWLGDPEATAAVGYAGAVLFFTTAFSIGASIAVSALVARALGARDPDRARELATSGMIWAAAMGTAFLALVWAFTPQITALLGATGGTLEKTVHFLRISLLGQPFLMAGIVGTAILRAHGDARRSMMTTVWGAVVLAALDPVLIFGFGWGLTGAAWAGVLSRLAILLAAIWPILRHHGGFAPVHRAGLLGDLAPLAGIAAPAILTQLATPVGQAIVTRLVAGYGEAAVAGMAIAGRLTPVAFGVIFALSGALGPIIGQNYGAGRMDRVRRAFIDGLIFTGVVIVTISALLFTFRGPIADVFAARGVTRDLIYLFCGPLSLLFLFNGWIFVANAACNNLRAPFLSTAVNWGRHTIGTLPPALLLAEGMGMGPFGVLIGQSLGGVLFGLFAVWLALRVIARVEPPPEAHPRSPSRTG